jgi:hypothetical protein
MDIADNPWALAIHSNLEDFHNYRLINDPEAISNNSKNQSKPICIYMYLFEWASGYTRWRAGEEKQRAERRDRSGQWVLLLSGLGERWWWFGENSQVVIPISIDSGTEEFKSDEA